MSQFSHTSNTSDSSDDDEQLAQLLVELTERVQRGEQVDIDSVCNEHRELADELRELWGTVMVADAAGSHSRTEPSPSNSDGPMRRFELPCYFGDFELLEQIGQGGMGIVYRAHQVSLNREVAVKMILSGRLASDTDLERFEAEAKAAGRLDHPGIVPVYEAGEHEGQPFFCMKYVHCKTLLQLLADGPLDPRDAARILSAVARAVHYAHREGILHRDLKPSNILIDDDGNPHITDFGLAKQVSDAASLTRTGAVIGTPTYMAPEQASGSRGQVSPTSDVYSLGTILYHMLAGHPPFRADSPVDLLLQVREQDPMPPRMINSKTDRDLEMIALRCLQKPPDLRYDSARSLADDLDAYLNDEPISARSGQFSQVIASLFRETHHATVLENWGLLWMWHSLVLFGACLLTNAMQWSGFRQQHHRWYYLALWTAGFWTWAAVFWFLRRRMGPVTFVERQIAHVWGATTIAIALLFILEWQMGLAVLQLSPVLGLIGAIVFMVKAGILSGQFYIPAALLFVTAFAMAWWPQVAHLIFGTVSGACFFFTGLKYYRQRLRATQT